MSVQTEIVQELAADSIVELFEVDLNPIGIVEQYYFHNGVNELNANVVFNGITYTRFPIEADGFERNGTGQQPRPTVHIGNITGLIGALSRDNADLVGVKFIRRRTFKKYLDAVNFTGGVNPTADPNAQLPAEIWYIDRKVGESRMFIEWELSSASDMTGLMLPRRQVIANSCTWVYRSAECGYAGGAVATRADVTTSDINLDACSRRLTGCRLRFGENGDLPFGGFSTVALIK